VKLGCQDSLLFIQFRWLLLLMLRTMLKFLQRFLLLLSRHRRLLQLEFLSRVVLLSLLLLLPILRSRSLRRFLMKVLLLNRHRRLLQLDLSSRRVVLPSLLLLLLLLAFSVKGPANCR